MSEETAFREAMRRDPRDDTTRLVYADWLEEHGNPTAAHRLRWWVGAQQHLRGQPTSGTAVRDGRFAPVVHRTLPQWVARLHQAQLVREAVERVPARTHPGVQDALHEAEIHALGLSPPESLPVSRAAALGIRGPNITPSVRFAVSGTLHSDPHALYGNHTLTDAHGIPTGGAEAAVAESNRQDHMAQILHAYAKHNPPPANHPTRLSRIGDMIRGMIGGKFDPRGPADGIVHTAKSNAEGAKTERTAIHAALSAMSPSHVRANKTDRYVDHVAELVKANPENPLVKPYVEAAKANTGDPTKLTNHLKLLLLAANNRQVEAGTDSRFVTPTYHAIPKPIPPYEVVESASVPPESTPVDLSDAPEAPAEKVGVAERTKQVLDALHRGGREGAVKHLMTEHGYTDRARALRHVRDAINRAKKAVDKPTKLAAYTGGAIKPEHVTGTVAARDPYTGAGKGFRSPLVGTSLAAHLRAIQARHGDLSEYVESALTGQTHARQFGTGFSHDPFTAISVALKQRNDPLAHAHDWKNLNHHLTHDPYIESAIRSAVDQHAIIAAKEARTGSVLNEHERELALWDTIARADKSRNAEQFFARVEKTLGGRHGDREAIKDAIERIRSRALDRAYTHASKGKEGMAEWRDTMGVKLARNDVKTPAEKEAAERKERVRTHDGTSEMGCQGCGSKAVTRIGTEHEGPLFECKACGRTQILDAEDE